MSGEDAEKPSGGRVLCSSTYNLIPMGLCAFLVTHCVRNRSEEALSLSCSALKGLATRLTLARFSWVGGLGCGGTEGLNLSRPASCAAVKRRHKCRNVGGLLRKEQSGLPVEMTG